MAVVAGTERKVLRENSDSVGTCPVGETSHHIFFQPVGLPAAASQSRERLNCRNPAPALGGLSIGSGTRVALLFSPPIRSGCDQLILCNRHGSVYGSRTH